MNDLAFKLLPMLGAMMISSVAYVKFDTKYRMTKRLCSKFNLKKELIVVFLLMMVIIIGVLGIYVIDLQPFVYFLIGGLINGVILGMMGSK